LRAAGAEAVQLRSGRGAAFRVVARGGCAPRPERITGRPANGPETPDAAFAATAQAPCTRRAGPRHRLRARAGRGDEGFRHRLAAGGEAADPDDEPLRMGKEAAPVLPPA